MVKANAYGHGLERAARALAAADGFALLDFQEAARLRVAGWRKPILLLEGFFEPRDLELLHKYRAHAGDPQRSRSSMLRSAELAGEIDVFLKMNSGMNRLGFTRRDACAPAYNALRMHPQVASLTLMTHFADADGAGRHRGAARLVRAS